MFCIDYVDFSIDPLLLFYNSTERETPILSIFTFHGPYKTQTELGFF
jgi:hypothetical protein